jgi:hypothetical protein
VKTIGGGILKKPSIEGSFASKTDEDEDEIKNPKRISRITWIDQVQAGQPIHSVKYIPKLNNGKKVTRLQMIF